MIKLSVISGGSSGLGFSIAAELIKNGKNILIVGRDAGKLIEATGRLQTEVALTKILAFACNIGIEKDVRKLGNYIKSKNLTVEYLFNNAGRGLEAKTKDLTSEIIDKVLEPNLKGMMLLTSEILKITPEEEYLTIVNIMSTSALVGRANETLYCAAKWGARGFTESLKLEMKGTKRNVMAVYPGGMHTPFWDTTNPERDLKGFMDPDDVAEKIVAAVLSSERSLISEITISRK